MKKRFDFLLLWVHIHNDIFFNPIKMPNFDKTGPAGAGPMTGKGKGNCGSNGAGMGQGSQGRRRRCCERGMGQGGFQNQQGNISLDEQEKFLEARLEAIREAKKSQNDNA